ncbi:MAG: HPr(Ser) kinase/phosphatase [Eubacteriales bacterium]|nr:HPr(Ser) kinase/phosphatase [Eubacteriales bacterium]
MKSIINEYPQNYDAFRLSSTVGTLAKRMDFTNLTPEIDLDRIQVTEYGVARPSLQLTGFFNFFAFKRVQIVGLVEQEYMKTLDDEVLAERFAHIASFHVPCIIFARNLQVKDSILDVCKRYGVPALKTDKETDEVEAEVIRFLRFLLAPRQTVHGELIDVFGLGVLIQGDSGIGKSEAALSLINRGHRLISDDLVEIRKVSEESLVGLAPELTRDFIELRGVGVVNIRAMYGYAAVKEFQTIDMIINLEEINRDKSADRFGLDHQYENILGVQIDKINIPVRPGRNMAVILESAALNFRARIMGYDAPADFMNRLSRCREDILDKQKSDLIKDLSENL